MTPLLLTLNMFCAADAVTTHYALERGAHELVLSQNPWVTDGIVAAQAVGVSILLARVGRKRPKLAKALGWTFVGARAAIVAHNARELRKLH